MSFRLAIIINLTVVLFIRETQIFRTLPAGALAFSPAGGEVKKNLLVEQLSKAFSGGEAD
jgi:hypothetical protein